MNIPSRTRTMLNLQRACVNSFRPVPEKDAILAFDQDVEQNRAKTVKYTVLSF